MDNLLNRLKNKNSNEKLSIDQNPNKSSNFDENISLEQLVQIEITTDLVQKKSHSQNESTYLSPVKKYNPQINQYVQQYYSSKGIDFEHNYKAFSNNTCPQCTFNFEKVVTKKRKCSNCGVEFNVRTNPFTSKRLFLEYSSIEHIELVSKHYSALNFSLKTAESLQAAEPEYLEIIRHFPTRRMNDVLWRLCNQRTQQYASEMRMGLYRNVRLQMAKISKNEDRNRDCLKFYIDVFFLDANGVTNTTVKIMDMYPPFDKESIFFAPGILNAINELLIELNISHDELLLAFKANNEQGFGKLLITTPEDAFKMFVNETAKLKNEMEEYTKEQNNGYDKVCAAEELHKQGAGFKVIESLLNEALQDGINDNFKARAYKLLGLIYQDVSPKRALSYFKNALKYHEKIGVKRIIGQLEKEIFKDNSEF